MRPLLFAYNPLMPTTGSTSDLAYSSIEIRSYLPSGWNLQQPEGTFEPHKRRWEIEVQDVSELVSTLAVDQKQADKLGRIPALRVAIDRLVRKA